GFAEVEVQTVVLEIAFPSVLDYVRVQLLATPMSALLSDLSEADRQATIKTIASETASFSDPKMLEDGGFSFGQEAYVGTARATGRSLSHLAHHVVSPRRTSSTAVGGKADSAATDRDGKLRLKRGNFGEYGREAPFYWPIIHGRPLHREALQAQSPAS